MISGSYRVVFRVEQPGENRVTVGDEGGEDLVG